MRLLLLGSGELGKEFAIAAQRLGLWVGAADRYSEAPAMAVAQESFVLDMLSAKDLRNVVRRFRPDVIVPEIEAIRTSELLRLEAAGYRVAPCARAAHLTMNRDAIRELAAKQLKLKTAKYAYAESQAELERVSEDIGFPNVVKPVMSSSGKGQSVVRSAGDVSRAWRYALSGMRGDQKRVIVEEFIEFEQEITLLTIRQRRGPTIFSPVIGHRQERGDYQESWCPARLKPAQLRAAKSMARRITDAIGGHGLFGVEFFLTRDSVYFSELSPRPHDTGLVTLISQDLSEFELHLRAILGLPIPAIEVTAPSASAVILAGTDMDHFRVKGLDKALQVPSSQVRVFGKPKATRYRRMGVALARGKSLAQARSRARLVAKRIKVIKVKRSQK